MNVLIVSLLFVTASVLPTLYYVWIPKVLIFLYPRVKGRKFRKYDFEKEFEQETGREAKLGVWSGDLVSGENRTAFELKTTEMLPSRHYFWNMYDQFVFLCRTLYKLLDEDENIIDINLAVQRTGGIKYDYSTRVNT